MEAYRNRYGTDPDDTAAATYDAFGLLFRAMRNQGASDPESIRVGLTKMGRYLGVTGAIEFAEGQDPVKSVVISRIQDGQAILYMRVDPQGLDPGDG